MSLLESNIAKKLPADYKPRKINDTFDRKCDKDLKVKNLEHTCMIL